MRRQNGFQLVDQATFWCAKNFIATNIFREPIIMFVCPIVVSVNACRGNVVWL
jgi:hypothetical protein